MAKGTMPWTASETLTCSATTLPTPTPAFLSTPQKGRAGLPHVYREQAALHSQLWRTVSRRGNDFDGLCGIDGQLRDQQTLCEAASDAVDKAGGTFAVADSGQDTEQ